MASIADLLTEAASEGALATITYNGGSKPGERRAVLPIRIVDGMLQAREPGGRATKSFALAKIANVQLANGTTAANFAVAPIAVRRTPVLDTLAEYAALLKPQYEAGGWHVHEAAARFGVSPPLKGGKARKHPTICISFIDRTVVETFDLNTGAFASEKQELTGRERPWRVDSKLQPQAKAFGELSAAIEFFASEVQRAASTT
jgi:hypothetical protein